MSLEENITVMCEECGKTIGIFIFDADTDFRFDMVICKECSNKQIVSGEGEL